MDKKNLIVKLTENLQRAKSKANWENYKEREESKQVFVQSETGINPRYLSNEQYFQIAEFYNFLEENKGLTAYEIRELLKGKLIKFAFLRKLDKLIPDFFEELKFHGPMSIATRYVSLKYYKHLNKKIDETLKRELP